MSKKNLVPDDGYRDLLEDLKNQIRLSQLQAAISVNQEMLLLYWYIGREILARQREQGWGSKVLERLSQDLKREFPDMKGFSLSNLKYMRAFAEAWTEIQISQRALANLPWRQNVALLEKLKDPNERLWYAEKAVENGWSRTILVAQIETGLYRREGGAVTNFERTLPPSQSELASQVVKDPYSFDFLTIAQDAKAQDLKRALVAHMRDFLLELGVGFSFVRQNYRLDIEGEEFQADMLFYHLRLRCFIVIQLEMGSFRPEQSGLMNFYIAAVDRQERQSDDQPTIGIILCKTKNRTIAEYALNNLRNPIAVAEHRFPNLLPTPEELEQELENAVQELEGEQES
ncbi:PDDEXK nuclease domain-containing protein [Halomicronema sp. CCY15110]|uniref:PDDEXK nuclease domain-containing protein n=1 Tax=Halomicronema sp. CCY15110 TaxID=2767773 RepID=UPI001950E751|nr:PDDEXK nuclease domain-containing protein [Halomicronema sp. CCY15110]